MLQDTNNADINKVHISFPSNNNKLKKVEKELKNLADMTKKNNTNYDLLKKINLPEFVKKRCFRQSHFYENNSSPAEKYTFKEYSNEFTAINPLEQ